MKFIHSQEQSPSFTHHITNAIFTMQWSPIYQEKVVKVINVAGRTVCRTMNLWWAMSLSSGMGRCPRRLQQRSSFTVLCRFQADLHTVIILMEIESGCANVLNKILTEKLFMSWILSLIAGAIIEICCNWKRMQC